MSTKVLRYGIRPPTKNAPIVIEQMILAHRYRNRLTEIERDRRSRLREIDGSLCRDLHAEVLRLSVVVESARSEIKKARKSERRRAETGEMKAALKDARDALKSARFEWRKSLAEMRQDVDAQARRDAVNVDAADARRAARAECGTYWGTYQLIEDADMAARKAPLWDGSEPNDPRFRRWDGTGQVSVQIVNGLSAKDMLSGASTQVQIVDRPDGSIDLRDPNSKRSQKHRRMMLRLRVCSDGRDPVWAEWPMVLHRPIPSTDRVKRATVALRKIGPREEWCVLITVETKVERSCGEGAIAIDLGWRQFADRIRVGMTFDSDDQMSEIVIAPRIQSGIQRANTLRATRDVEFDALRDVLAAWISDREDAPEWLVEAGKWMPRWRSQSRMASLAAVWRDARFGGDSEMFEAVEAWRRQDRHLWLWETSQREGALRARREHYRCVAADLARRYETLILEDFDLRKIATKKDEAENQTARSNRVDVAVSEFRLALKNAFLGRGGSVTTVSAVNTTRECSTCGSIEEFDAAGNVRHTCVNGHEWDQDENAARNIFERWRDAPDVGAARSPDEPTESRWSKARRMGAERDVRMGRSKGTLIEPVTSGES